jgi:deoxyribose-phosphate aldolase
MEYTNKLNEYNHTVTAEQVAESVEKARALAPKNHNTDVYKMCYSCIDLTALSVDDSESSITEFTRKTVEFPQRFPELCNVASICVYPAFIETVGLAMGQSDIRITSVAGGFPSSQTWIEVKMLEVAMAVENGADEVDIVMSVGELLDGKYEQVAGEIELIADEVGNDVVLKVILETGALPTPELIRKASLLAMLAGADFIKTSTGKIPVAATPEAAVVMCGAIRDFYEKTGRMVGFKAAGGVKTAEDAALYYTIVEMILGEGWLTPSLFRIGASSAANNILSSITGETVRYY